MFHSCYAGCEDFVSHPSGLGFDPARRTNVKLAKLIQGPKGPLDEGEGLLSWKERERDAHRQKEKEKETHTKDESYNR